MTMLALMGAATTFWVSARQAPETQPSIWELDWNSDGTRLAGANSDGSISIWDNTGLLLRSLTGLSGSVSSVDWHPVNRHLLASISYYDEEIHLWDSETGNLMRTIHAVGFRDGIYVVRWSRQGDRLIAAGFDVYQIWDTVNWTPLTDIETGSMYDMIWDMSDAFVIVAGLTDIHRIDISPLNVTSELDFDWLPVRALSWNPNGQQFAAVGRTQPFVSLWSVSPLAQMHSFDLDAIANDISYINENYVAVGLANGEVLIMNPQTGDFAQQLSYSGEIRTIAWNPVYSIIAVGGQTDSEPDQAAVMLELVVPVPDVLTQTHNG